MLMLKVNKPHHTGYYSHKGPSTLYVKDVSDLPSVSQQHCWWQSLEWNLFLPVPKPVLLPQTTQDGPPTEMRLWVPKPSVCPMGLQLPQEVLFRCCFWGTQIRTRESWEGRKDEYYHFQWSRAVLSFFMLFHRVMKIQKIIARNYSLVLTAGARRHSRHRIEALPPTGLAPLSGPVGLTRVPT